MTGAIIKTISLKPENGFRPDLAEIRAAIGPKTKAILINSPSNPTGVVLSDDELKAICALGIWVISDEIYRGIEFGETPSSTALKFSQENLIVIDGFSKRHAMTGFRLGYGIFPKQIIAAADAIHQNLIISANAFVQAAGAEALTNPVVPSIRAEWVHELAQRRDFLLEGLKKLNIAVPAIPDGAFYVLADFRWLKRPSLELAFAILEEAGLALAPGIDFGHNTEGFLRISFTKPISELERGLYKLQQWLIQ